MSNSSSPPVQQACKTARSVKLPLSVKYTEETLPTRLSEAEEYFGLCIAKVFLVSEGDYNSKGSEGLAKGEKIDVYLLFVRVSSGLTTIYFLVQGTLPWAKIKVVLHASCISLSSYTVCFHSCSAHHPM